MEVRPTIRPGAPGPTNWLQRRAAPAIRRPLAAGPVDAPAHEASTGVAIQRKCAACEEDESRKHLQAKSSISAPGDPLEREADSIADAVIGAPADTPVVARSAISTVQRKDAPGAVEGVPSIVGDVVRSGGQPLDPAERAYFEPRLGVDLGGVRVHTDGRAAASARAVNAHAYTVGNDVVFGAGRYAPGSAAARHLLAHELAHVVQQARSGGPMSAPLYRRPEDSDENSSAASAHTPGGPYHPPEGVEMHCTSGDDCSTLSTKINYLRHTIKRHREWDLANPDARYPGGRHAQEISSLEAAMERCKAWYTTKCTNQPRFIPVPHPQGDGEKAPEPTRRVRDVLTTLGLSVLLVALVLAALALPHPGAKLASVLGSVALAKIVLKRLGRRPEPGFDPGSTPEA